MSNYATMIEVNGNVNRSRQMNRIPVPYFKAVLESPLATDEDKAMAQSGLDQIEGFDKLLCEGYVSTGRQYDDEWCDRVEREDRYWDTLDQRYGTTAVEEAEAEIAHQIAQKRAGEAADAIDEYFTAEVTQRLFPAVTIEVHDGEEFEVKSDFWEPEYRSRWGAREVTPARPYSLSEYGNVMLEGLQEGWEYDERNDHGD